MFIKLYPRYALFMLLFIPLSAHASPGAGTLFGQTCAECRNTVDDMIQISQMTRGEADCSSFGGYVYDCIALVCKGQAPMVRNPANRDAPANSKEYDFCVGYAAYQPPSQFHPLFGRFGLYGRSYDAAPSDPGMPQP